MDPEAVVREARGEVDQALLTRTGGGLLGRNVLADEPLLAHLQEGETLHYLLAGAAAPTRTRGGEREPLETSGGFRTLLAVTDRRVLLVAGSADGDRSFAFDYGDLVAVDHDPGILTDAVTIEEGTGRTWRVPVGSGSDPGAAVAYASERLSAADPTPAGGNDLVDAVFARLVEDPGAGFGVEQYATDGLDALLSDLRAHHERLREHVASGDREAAVGAAATVEDIAAEGESLAAERDRPMVERRVVATRREARRTLVAAALGLADPEPLEDDRAAGMKRLLRTVHPGAFERFVADLWSELGYRTTVTQSSRDHGVDVVAHRAAPVEQTMVIQAKRYGADATVGREAVQQYASLHRQEADADLVVVVTTGTFTDPAVEAAAELDVKLVDADALVELVEERELFALVADYVDERDAERGEDATRGAGDGSGGMQEGSSAGGDAGGPSDDEGPPGGPGSDQDDRGEPSSDGESTENASLGDFGPD